MLSTDAGPSRDDPTGPGTPDGAGRRRTRGLLRAGGAVLAGLGLYAAFPPLGWWWTAPLGIALLLAVVDPGPDGGSGRSGWSRRRLGSAFGWGALAALAYQYPLLSWTGTYVGAIWLLALAVVVLAVAVPVALLPVVMRLPGAPLWVAGVWVAGEALIERVPFGGFPWAELAFGQADGPYARLATLGGAPLVTAGVVLTGAGLWSLTRWSLARHSVAWGSVARGSGGTAPTATRRPGVPAAVGALVAVLLGPLGGLAVPANPAAAPGDRAITVAAVQGDVPQAGLDFSRQRRAVLDNHIRETRLLALRVDAGEVPRPDVVIWPENSSDIDPFRDASAGAAIQAVTDEIGAPVVVGAVLSGLRAADGTTLRGPRNAAVVWEPLTATSPGGPADQYVKRHLLPFGEYVPLRPLGEAVTPLVERVTDFEPGTDETPLAAGPARIGIATCYEVVFDAEVRDVVRAGADLLAVPTNNATFGYTDMTYQQQGMSRLRAVEHDRAVVIAATSGQSAVIAPDGEVVARTGELFTPGVLVETVPLRTTTTVATRVGAAPELVLAALGVVALGASGLAGGSPAVGRMLARLRPGGGRAGTDRAGADRAGAAPR